MVQVDIPGLPKDLNVNYRPPRVSLFPPSYRDRAYLRSIHRQVLRQTADLRKEAEEEAAKKGPAPKKKPEESKSSQTTESYCYHVCSAHPIAGKKVEGNKNPVMKDTGTNPGKPKKKKGKQSSKGIMDGSDEETDSSEDSDDHSQIGQNKANKNKKNQTKKGQKSNKHVRWNDEDSMRPMLPYPLSSPYAESFWSRNTYQNKDDTSGWNLDHKLEAARRADEKYMWNWLAQHEGNYKQSAFQWLADRDSQRQAKLAQAAYDLAGLSLDPMSDSTPLAFPPRSGYSHAQHTPADMGGHPRPSGYRQDYSYPEYTGYPHNNFNQYAQQSYRTPNLHNHHQGFPYPGHSGNPPPPNNMQHGGYGGHPANQSCSVCDQWHQAHHGANGTNGGPGQQPAHHTGFDRQSKSGGIQSPRISHKATSPMPKQYPAVDTTNLFARESGNQQYAPAKQASPITNHHPFFADDPPQGTYQNDHVMSGAIQPFSTRWGKETW